MATESQRRAARKNVRKAIETSKRDRTIAHLPKETRSALGRQAAAVARRKRTGGAEPKTRSELYEEAKKRDIRGRSKMGRADLERALRRR
jgi:hypothetical protein